MKTPSRSRVAFAVCCFIFAAVACKAADDKAATTPHLAVVRTWADLLAQKPVMIQPAARSGEPTPAPVACKLGISEATGEHYGGAVLYCLMERGGDELDAFASGEALGPFLVDIGQPGDIQNANAHQEVAKMDHVKKPGSACLYMKTIPLARVGDCHIEVREWTDGPKKSDPITVAKATVKVLEKRGTYWSPWNDPDKETGDTPGLVDDGNYSLMVVANPVGGVAVPRWDGWEPVFIAKIPNGKLPLPQIFPAEVDPGIQLGVKGSLLTVKLADDEMSTYYPDEDFLTRWWVNGKPVQLKTDASAMKRSRQLGAMEKLVKEIRFQVEFHPDRLGVKKGDKVGVQLLFCPKGWKDSSGQMAVLAQAMLAIEDDKPEPWRISRMSNKVDFVYSGDPASAAQ